MNMCKRFGKSCGASLRCNLNHSHEVSILSHSFFENSKLTIQDILVFVKYYLEKSTLKQCARFAGMSYGSTAVDWACMIRELFKEHYQLHISGNVLSGEIEIDESLFGRRVKYHRGNPGAGLT